MEFVDTPVEDSNSSDSDTSDDKKFIKILAIGDSLTEGYHKFGFSFHPYTNKLEKCCDEYLKEISAAREVLISQQGVSGEFTDCMIRRLHGILEAAETNGHPFQIVCILGGTNDLSDEDDTPEIIFSRLKQMYEKVLAHGNATLAAITIPEAGFLDEAYISTRNGVNNLIKDFCASNPERIILVDLNGHIRFFADTGQKNTELWDDALHMTPAGYDKFGELVFENIKQTLAQVIAG